MDTKKLFDGFDPTEYDEEVRERWGDTDAYAESARRTKGYSETDWATLKSEGDQLMQRMADLLGEGVDATNAAAIEIAEQHRLYIERWFYPCNRAMHAGLAQMYDADPRFTATFDAFAPGLATFFAKAIRANAELH